VLIIEWWRQRAYPWRNGGIFELARYDVYRNSGQYANAVPYLLDVQSDLLYGLETRIVVPLRCRNHFPDGPLPERLIPIFEVEGIACLMETPKLAAVPLRLLKQPVTSLAESHAIITAALDFMFQGY